MLRRRVAIALGLIAAGGAACVLLLLSRAPRAPLPAARQTGVKVVLIGIDGASLRVMDPLLASGRLPQIKALMDAGAWGVLRSEDPMKSPALWTTIATGRSRQDHGITDFVIPRGLRGRPSLVGSKDRRALALWNIVSAFGRRVGFLGFWASWPAEPVKGWLVSDRATRERWNEWAGGRQEERLAYPASLATELEPLIVDPMDPPMDVVEGLVSLDEAEKAEFKSAKKPVFAHGLSVFKFAFCSQLSYERMAMHLLARDQPTLTGIFLVANDPVSHTFWHYYEPGAFPGTLDKARAARLGRLVPALYEHNDTFLKALLERLAPQTVVMIVSDHGFEASGSLPATRPARDLFEGPEAERAALNGVIAVGQSGKHDLSGVFIAAGGPIRKATGVRASIYDVAPTVLALLGLPVPRDMPGRVLEEAIDPMFLAEHPVRRIPSYEPLVDRDATLGSDGGDDEQKKDLLRSLGYIR